MIHKNNSSNHLSKDEIVDEIFEELNFLKLKKTSEMFLSLDDSILEKFSEKYSSILIYLLNILDHETTSKLIAKLTKKSILYLIEEETRLLLLSTFSIGESLEELTKISFLIDELDAKENENFILQDKYNEIKEAISLLMNFKIQKDSKLKFNYLLNFDINELNELIDLIYHHKPVILSILLVFSPDSVKQFLISSIIKNRPNFLKVLPANVYDLKYFTYLKNDTEKLKEFLPEDVRNKLEYLEIVKKIEAGLDKIILELKQSNINTKEKKEKILNEVYELLVSESPEIQNLILIDLANKGYLSSQELEILQIIFKHNI